MTTATLLTESNSEAVEADHQDHDREEGVRHRQQRLRLICAEEPVQRPDEDVAAREGGDRKERDRRQQREERADDPAHHPEVRTAGDRVGRPVRRAEQRHRSKNDPSDDDPEQEGKQAFPEGEPEEQDREGTQDDGRKGVRSAEGDAEEVERLGCAVRRGNRLDAVLLDLGDPRRIVPSPRAGNRFFADGHREERTAGQGSEECAEPAELALRARDRSDGILRRLAGRGCF